MLLPPFQLHEPQTVQEAIEIRARHPDADWIAGGSDLLPNYKWGLNTRRHVVSLHRVAELRGVTTTKLGATATLSEIAQNADLWRSVPVVPHTASLVASPLIRNSATLGGNLMLENRCFFFNQSYPWREGIDFCLKAEGDQCHVVPQEKKCYATFSADLPGALIPLGAEVELVGPRGTRRLKLSEFYKNDGIDRHQRRPEELLSFVHLPPDAAEWKAGYQKLRQRDSWDFPELGIGAAVKLEGETLTAFRLCANALECAPKTLDHLGQPYLGRRFTDEVIEAIAAEVEASVRPVKNTNLSPSYRKRMSRVFARRALREARAGGPTRRLNVLNA